VPTVLITPEALVRADGPHIKLLQEAGFDIAFPKNPQFTRGLGDEVEGVDELSGADAVIAGSEHITAWMLDRLELAIEKGTGLAAEKSVLAIEKGTA
jgi:hypothetical protein